MSPAEVADTLPLLTDEQVEIVVALLAPYVVAVEPEAGGVQ